MELNQEHLKEKALLLLRCERELFELRTKHEEMKLWLNLNQALPRLLSDPHVDLVEVYARLQKTLVQGLRLQRVLFIRVEGETLRPVVPAGPPRPLAIETRSLLQAEAAGFCNDPIDPATAALAESVGLARFIWSRIDLPRGETVVVAAGFDKAKARFQMPYDAADAAHLRNAAQHVQALIGNMTLVQELERERDTLDQRVRERTKELGRRNRDMRLVLDNVAQALLTIDAAGRLSRERSARADDWFGPYDGNPPFADYIARIDRKFSDGFALGHQALVEKVLPEELCLDQLPHRLRAGERIFDCTYFPLPEDGDGAGLLIVIDDVTEQVRLTQEESEQSELLALFQGLLRDREGFVGFFDEARHLVDELARGNLDEATRTRHLHTLKGTAAMNGAKVIADLCHRAEDELSFDGPAGVATTIGRLKDRWAAVQQALQVMMDDRSQGTIEISARAFDQVCEDLRSGIPVEQLVWRLKASTFEPVGRPLTRLSQYGRALAQQMGKGDVSILIQAGDVRVDPRRFRGLWSSLVHVVRNAIDHGLEPPADRLARGKNAQGQVFLRAFESSNDLVLEIEDDGRGIDWGRVGQLASARGLRHVTEADLVRAVLSGGFSTRSTVSLTSGRGVGMTAVNHQVLELGGALSVHSQDGVGTCWRISIPLSAEHSAGTPVTEVMGGVDDQSRGEALLQVVAARGDLAARVVERASQPGDGDPLGDPGAREHSPEGKPEPASAE